MSKENPSYGERAVGYSFNPSNHKDVDLIKEMVAEFIDFCDEKRRGNKDGDVIRMLSIAITEIQTAQMWAVKAVTWDK